MSSSSSVKSNAGSVLNKVCHKKINVTPHDFETTSKSAQSVSAKSSNVNSASSKASTVKADSTSVKASSSGTSQKSSRAELPGKLPVAKTPPRRSPISPPNVPSTAKVQAQAASNSSMKKPPIRRYFKTSTMCSIEVETKKDQVESSSSNRPSGIPEKKREESAQSKGNKSPASKTSTRQASSLKESTSNQLQKTGTSSNSKIKKAINNPEASHKVLIKQLKPREIPKDKKAEQIIKGNLMRGKNDYPTMQDVLSDWSSQDSSTQKSLKKKQESSSTKSNKSSRGGKK